MVKVLVLGGCGFIGINLVKYLVEGNLATKVRVADKRMPEIVGLSKTFAPAFQKVEFMQVNLINQEAVASVFAGETFDVVINLAAETKKSLEPSAYEEGIVQLAVTCAKEAAKHNVQKFIYVSTTKVYEASNKAKNESGKIDPWTIRGKAALQAEEELKKIPGLNFVIVRPAIAYGPGDVAGLGPRIAVAAVYKKTGKPMKLLWGGQLKISTVHVADLAHAIWFLVKNGEVGKVYNVADKNDTDQEKINLILEKIFGIKTGYKSKITAQVAASISMAMVTDEVNARHIDPWAAICKDHDLTYSKLSPYLDEELLYNKDLCVDGSAIEKIGFSYEHPKLTEEALREVINEYIVAGWFPKNFL